MRVSRSSPWAERSLAEIARAEEINDAYVSRLLRLTLLAPDIVEAILDGRQVPGLQLEALLKPIPVEWERQKAVIDKSVRRRSGGIS